MTARAYATGFVLLGILLGAALAYAGYYLGWVAGTMSPHNVMQKQAYLLAEQERLNMAINALEKRNNTFMRQNLELRQAARIETAANAEIQQDLVKLRKELSETREKLTFYRSIVSPDANKSGLQLYEFQLSEGQQPGLYHYTLMLVQAKQQRRDISGTIKITVHGVQYDDSNEYGLKEVTFTPLKKRQYQFRYFVNLKGELLMPPDFAPTRVIVNIQPTSPWRKPLQEAYEWTNLLESAAQAE